MHEYIFQVYGLDLDLDSLDRNSDGKISITVGMKNAEEKMKDILLSRLQTSSLTKSQMKFTDPKSFIVSGSV